MEDLRYNNYCLYFLNSLYLGSSRNSFSGIRWLVFSWYSYLTLNSLYQTPDWSLEVEHLPVIKLVLSFFLHLHLLKMSTGWLFWSFWQWDLLYFSLSGVSGETKYFIFSRKAVFVSSELKICLLELLHTFRKISFSESFFFLADPVSS